MAITAATRQDIIELVVTALNAAPGTTLLNELVAIVDGGGTLADVAANLAASDTFTARYPAFQTAEEFAAEWLGNLIPEAGADAMAEAKALVVAAVNGGTTAASLILQAQEFLSAASESDAAFGTSAANFNNKAEVASHQTLTNETAALDTTALASVTSDDATVATAKTALDTIATPGTTVALTKNVDAATGTAGDDTFTAVAPSAATQTLNAGDTVTGGDGTDKLSITNTTTGGASLGAGVTTSGVEGLSVNAVTATTVDASTMPGITDVYNAGSLADITINNAAFIPNVHTTSSSSNTTVNITAATTVGLSDSATIALNGSAMTSSNTVTMNGIETFNVVASGTASGSATKSTTLASDRLHTITITGDASSSITATLAAATATQTGTVTGNDQVNRVSLTADATDVISVDLGAGNDVMTLNSIGAKYTVAGGDGTDTIASTVAISAAAGAGISGFENASVGAVAISLSGTANTIDSVTFTDTGGSLAGLATGATVTQKAGGTNTVSNATGWTGTSDSITVNVGSAAASGAFTQSLNAAGIETATINNSEISTSNSARTVGVTGANLTKATVTSGSTGTITFAGGGTKMTELDMSGVSGATAFTASATNTAAAGFTLKGGAKASTLTGFTGADTIVGGAGKDTITGGVGQDTLTGGAAADTFVFAANATGAVVSSLTKPDTITDFTSGTDKLNITNATSGAVTSFLGNFSSVSSAQAQAALTGKAGQAYYVTGDNQLYVTNAANGVAVANDTVITLTGVATLAASDLLLGSQGAGSAVTITAPGVLSTAANAGASKKTSAGDDTITQANTVAVGTGTANGSTINGGAGSDTYNLGLLADTSLTSLTTSGANTTSTALTSVENVNLTVKASTGAVTVGTLPATLESLTVVGTDNNAALSATIGAVGQSITVTNTTASGNASAITFGAFASQSATTGAANDTFNTIAVDGITAVGGIGNDTFNVSAVAAFDNDNTAITITGGTGTDKLVFADGLTGTIDFSDTENAVTGVESIDAGAAAAGAMAITLGGSDVRTIIGDSTTANVTFTGTAAQIDALTTITSDAAGNTFSVVSSDTGSVTVDLSDTTYTTLANVDSVTFAATTATGVVTATIDENLAVVGGAGTSDVLIIDASLGAVTVAASAFETVSFTTAAQAGAVQAQASAVTINSSVAQAGLTVGAATTAVNTSNATGAAIVVDDTTANTTTFTHTGAGTFTLTMAADTRTADTVTVTGSTGVATINQVANAGVTTITLSATNTAADVIGLAGTGITAALDRVVVNNFDPSGEDKIGLDVDNTTVATAAGSAAVVATVSAAGAVTHANTTDVTILNYDMGGTTEVLAGDLTGASLLTNLGGALSVTATTNKAYIIAFDNGNAYLYHFVEGTAGAGDTTVDAGDIALLGVFNGVAVGQLSANDISLLA